MMLSPSKEATPPVPTRIDHVLIADMVSASARVLDIGCGNGELLALLAERRRVDGRGLEISREGVNLCVARGLSVIQGDADYDLDNYPDGAFDYAILSSTIQATARPKHVLEQLLRIGRHAIVSFPNFGHWYIRTQFFLHGKMPVTGSLPYSWYDSPNIHLCSIKDFTALCAQMSARVERVVALNETGAVLGLGMPGNLQNLMATQAVFLLSRDGHPPRV